MENRPIRYVYMATPEESEKTLHKVVDLLVFWAKEEKRKEEEKSEKDLMHSGLQRSCDGGCSGHIG